MKATITIIDPNAGTKDEITTRTLATAKDVIVRMTAEWMKYGIGSHVDNPSKGQYVVYINPRYY